MSDDIRDLLEDAVADVQPRDGLPGIRARAAARRPRRGWVWGGTGAAVAAAAAVAVVATVGMVGGSPAPRPGPAGTLATARSTAYFVGSTGPGLRLFAEAVTVSPATRLSEAVGASMTGSAADPDYHSMWPTGATVASAAVRQGRLTVDLSGAVARRPRDMSADQARIALQQLVWTATAGSSAPRSVRFLLDGRRTPTVLGEPTSRPVGREAADDVLSPLSIGAPSQDAHVGTTFTVRGHASTFEGNVRWQLLRGGAVVHEGFTTARECCTLAPYTFTVRASPGRYVLKVLDQDDSDGEGVGPSSDTKDLTVG